jgi:hypothetical protein
MRGWLALRLPVGNHPVARRFPHPQMNLWRVGHILLMLPNACIIHAARHPLDVAMSCYAQPFSYSSMPWAWDLDDIAEQVRGVWS